MDNAEKMRMMQLTTLIFKLLPKDCEDFSSAGVHGVDLIKFKGSNIIIVSSYGGYKDLEIIVREAEEQ